MQAGDRIGPYEVHGLIGRGGMAEVYKVWQTHLHRYEALKVPLTQAESGVDPELMLRFLREARLSARLHHPNIATIHGVSENDAAQPYFAMEYIDGEDLANLLARRGKMSLEESLPIIRQIGEALDYAHTRPEPVVHRDIKPSNILLEADEKGGWQAKVVDFGIARAQEQSAGTRLTKAGMIVGTPEYMSPEQAQTPDLVNKRSDIYAFGIIVYEMLCGKPPFSAHKDTSPISVLLKHAQEEPPSPSQIAPGLSSKANAAILKVLSKNPLDRFDSCAAFVEALSPKGSPPKHHLLRSVAVTVTIAVVVMLTALGAKKYSIHQKVQKDVKMAVNAIESGDFQKGEKIAFDTIQLEPHNQKAWYQYCLAGYNIALQNHQFDTVSVRSNQAAKRFPNNQEIADIKAKISLSQVNYRTQDESNKVTQVAMNLIDEASARREELIQDAKAGKITAKAAIHENNTQLIPQFRQAEKKAYQGIELHKQNDVAWLQYCRAGYYLAVKKEDFEKTLKRIRQAEHACPQSTKFLLLKQLVKKDGKL